MAIIIVVVIDLFSKKLEPQKFKIDWKCKISKYIAAIQTMHWMYDVSDIQDFLKMGGANKNLQIPILLRESVALIFLH